MPAAPWRWGDSSVRLGDERFHLDGSVLADLVDTPAVVPRVFARLDAGLAGAAIAVRDGGLTMATVSTGDTQSALSDIEVNSGSWGFEVVVYGDEQLGAGAAVLSVGFCRSGFNTTHYPGEDSSSIAWYRSAAANEVRQNNALVDGGDAMPAVVNGDIIGVRIDIDTTNTITFYLNGEQVRSVEFTMDGPFRAGVGLRTAEAGTLSVAINTGQWGFSSMAARAGLWADGAIAGEARLADEEFTAATTDAPPNAQFLGKIEDGLSLIYGIDFWVWDGSQSQSAVAQLRVSDADGGLDALALADARGIPVAILQVDQRGEVAAATPIARFVVDGIVVEDDGFKTINLTDAHNDLDNALASKVFLPSIPTLAWQLQPVVIGAVASVPALPVNSDGTTLWLADAPLASVADVLDRGDSMEVGEFGLSPSGQQLNMATPPVGPVVCDVSSVGENQQPATLELALREIFSRIGKSAWSADDAAAIDTATGYAGIGWYTNQATTVRAALQAILPSYGAWWYQDAEGVIRLARVVDPAAFVGALSFDLAGSLLKSDVITTADRAPNLSRRMAYRVNAKVLGAADLVTDVVDVPQARRDELTSVWRGQVYGAGSLAQRYNHADNAAPLVSCFWRREDAQTEIDRVLALYRQPRHFYQVEWQTDDQPPAPGTIGRLAYSRYGLDAGKQLLVRRVTSSPSTGDVTLLLWG